MVGFHRKGRGDGEAAVASGRLQGSHKLAGTHLPKEEARSGDGTTSVTRPTNERISVRSSHACSCQPFSVTGARYRTQRRLPLRRFRLIERRSGSTPTAASRGPAHWVAGRLNTSSD